MKHKGSATETGTSAYAENMGLAHGIPEGNYKTLSLIPTTPTLYISSLGIGTYLGPEDCKTDELVTTAVMYSVSHGWNVIDTASNYRKGRAEVCVGQALDTLLAGNLQDDFLREVPIKRKSLPGPGSEQGPDPAPMRPDITRDMLFISTKAGFVQPDMVKALIKEGKILPGDVAGGKHCIHPSCLEASLKQSLSRMHLEKVDLLYLHNTAEVQLQDLGKEHFLKRITAAFTYLERDPGHLSLDEVVEIAKSVGGASHGFRFIQLPINVGMMEAFDNVHPNPINVGMMEAFEKSLARPVTGSDMTVLDAAKNLNVGVFASGPLGEGEMLSRYTGKLDGVRELLVRGNGG
eukprot:gene31592-6786_t